MADAQQRTGANEIAGLLSQFLISADVSNASPLEEFKELFPLKFRDHEDVKQLYKAFQSKRKKLRAIVKRNIARHCSPVLLTHDQLDHSPDEHSDDEQKHLKEKLASVRKEIKATEKQFNRCAKQLNDIDMFQGLSDKDFHVDALQLLGKKLEKPGLSN